MKTLKEIIDLYTKNWFDGLIKSWKHNTNKKALKSSYEFVAERAKNEYKDGLPFGIQLILKERLEQLEKHGWNPEHDDEHVNGELLTVATCLLTNNFTKFPDDWHPRFMENLMCKKGVEALKVAGALIAAEIDRLQRLEDVK